VKYSHFFIKGQGRIVCPPCARAIALKEGSRGSGGKAQVTAVFTGTERAAVNSVNASINAYGREASSNLALTSNLVD